MTGYKYSEKIHQKIKYIVSAFSIMLSLFVVAGCSGKSDKNNISSKKAVVKDINVSCVSDEYAGKEYYDVVSELESEGFTNISTKEIEDLKASDEEKLNTVENVSIDGKTDFSEGDSFKSDVKVVVEYHGYAKCEVKLHVNFIPNLLFSKYDVELKFDGMSEGNIKHGKDADFELSVDPGEYTVEFVSADSSSVTGETKLKVTGNVNVSYKISCYSDEITVENEYTENLDQVGESDIMMPSDASEYNYKNYKEVESTIKDLGFTNISTEILYDIVFGITDEGETESVSIGGNRDFKRGDIFSKDEEVVITYHMKEEDDPDKETDEMWDEEDIYTEDEQENLTVDNCPELASILSNKAEFDDSYYSFATKYEGRIIEFDGRTDYCANHGTYDTRFDYLVSAGDYIPDSQIGPVFKFENVGYYDLHTDLETVSVGLNVHIVAKVISYDANSGLFYLEPIAVTSR